MPKTLFSTVLGLFRTNFETVKMAYLRPHDKQVWCIAHQNLNKDDAPIVIRITTRTKAYLRGDA